MTQHTRHSDAVWASLREAYLAGRTQPELAEHYNVGVSTIRDRARREGWRRCDQPPPDVAPLGAAEDEPEDEAMRPLVAVIGDAYRRAEIAFRRGRTIEAERRLRVARGFERLWSRADGLDAALDRQWRIEEGLLAMRLAPPWPEGVADETAAWLELDAFPRRFGAALAGGLCDPDVIADLIDRRDRLRFCLECRDIPLPTADPPEPPEPPSESDTPPGDEVCAAPETKSPLLPSRSGGAGGGRGAQRRDAATPRVPAVTEIKSAPLRLGGRGRGWARGDSRARSGEAAVPDVATARIAASPPTAAPPRRAHPKPLPPNGRGAANRPQSTFVSSVPPPCPP